MYPLHDKFDRIAAQVPRVELGVYPTPVQELPGFDLRYRVFVKRDDLTSPIYGGNKVRKLELLLADVERWNRSRIVTYGAYASNQVLATAIFARRRGKHVSAILYPQPVTPRCTDNFRALVGLGVEIWHSRSPVLAFAEINRVLWHHRKEPGGSYAFPMGGSNALSSLGFVNAALELSDQVARGECPAPDAIFVAAGTCGTLAGLTAGVRLAGLDCPVYGVRVIPRSMANRTHVAKQCNEILDLIRRTGTDDPNLPRHIGRDDVQMIHDEYGTGYGASTPAAENAVERFKPYGLRLETTYTGKAAAALIAAVEGRSRVQLRGPNVFFWLTYNAVDIAPLVAAGPSLAELPEPFNTICP